MVVIKVVEYCIRIDITFVRKESDFHAYDFLSLEGPQLAGLSARALGPGYIDSFAKINNFYYYHFASFQSDTCPTN